MKISEVTVESKKIEEIKEVKIVEDPRLSLGQFARYCVGSPSVKKGVLMTGKYPSGYIPRYYVPAIKIIRGAFDANFDESDLYFEEFLRRANVLEREAIAYPVNKDEHKNRFYSARALKGLVDMRVQIDTILQLYEMHDNSKRGSITIEGVRINAKADMLLYEQGGVIPIGFMIFNFTQKPLTDREVHLRLFILRTILKEKYGKEMNENDCILIDVVPRKIYRLALTENYTALIKQVCNEIKVGWPLL